MEARLDPSVVFDDFVAGKGKGINILLQYCSTSFIYLNVLTEKSGPPGVGKTVTAEAVSKRLKRPLILSMFSVLHAAKPSLTVQICAGELPIEAAKQRS